MSDINIFNHTIIYNTLFFNVVSVTNYGSAEIFEKEDKKGFDAWEQLFEKKHKETLTQNDGETIEEFSDRKYMTRACFYPEFSKIVAISCATLTAGEDGELKRNFIRLDAANGHENEGDILTGFNLVLEQADKNGFTICGHNIVGHDIPTLAKRYIYHRNTLKSIPTLIKNYLSAKPWNSKIIDTLQVWKFNGYELTSMNTISKFLNLKQSVELLDMGDLNKKYWYLSSTDCDKMISLQSATFTNLCIQLINELRHL